MVKKRNWTKDFDFEMIQNRIFNDEKSILGFPLFPFLWEICLMQNMKQILNPVFLIEHTLHFLSEVEKYNTKT